MSDHGQLLMHAPPWVLARQAIERRRRMDEDAQTDIVEGSTRNTDAETYFRAILTDAQIEALEEAAKNSDHLTGEYGAAPDPVLAGAVVALQNAEKIL